MSGSSIGAGGAGEREVGLAETMDAEEAGGEVFLFKAHPLISMPTASVVDSRRYKGTKKVFNT